MSSFCKCKSYSHFFCKNISLYAIFNDQSFNDKLTNNIVSFEQLGPTCVDPSFFLAIHNIRYIFLSVGSYGIISFQQFRGLNTPGKFAVIFNKGNNFVTYYLVSYTPNTSCKGCTLKEKNLLAREANSFLLEWTPFQKGGKNDSDSSSF